MLYVNFFKKSTCEEFHLKRALAWISRKEFLWLRILYTIYDLEIPSTNIAQEKISYETMSNKFDRKYIRMLFLPLIYVDWSKNQKIGCNEAFYTLIENIRYYTSWMEYILNN